MTSINKIKKFLILLLFLFSITHSSATELTNDSFNAGLDGWSGTGISNNSGWMRIERDSTVTKTYNLGIANANKPVTIQFTLSVPSEWEDSGSYQDYFNVFVNGTIVQTYSHGDGTHIHSFTAALDSAGDITLAFNPDTTANNEYAKIDYVNIDDTVDPTDYETGFQDFKLVNPPSTRNVLGNYAIAGNTVMCITDKTSGYGGTCQDAGAQRLTSNNRVSKYIDIDGDSSTWNSSSSYINIPNSYDKDRGILWAGLFWQGRFSTDTNYAMHYGMENGNAYNLIEMGRNSPTYNAGSTINIKALEANKIKLKIDTGGYNDVTASTVYTYKSSNGKTYAASADVTGVMQDLDVGKHVFTVANLRTNEGREPSPGVFGGWSLVVIYAEGALGDARNISIYSGFESIGQNNDPISISGFKLPKSGDVSSQLAVFSGEGEHLYGRNTTNTHQDWMKISDKDVASSYQYMPGLTAGTHLGNRDNMFNAVLDGVLRDDIAGQSNNLQVNNDGVDIDVFDVSTLMEGYRDANVDINEIFIKVYSNNDYITSSMIAFAAELYKPNICYDYAVRLDDFTLPSQNREINTVPGSSLNINVSIKSLEGDFDLQNTTLAVDVTPSGKTEFNGNALYSQPGTNIMLPAIVTDSTRPQIAFGRDVTSQGGTLGAFEIYFSKFGFDFTTSGYFKGQFDIELLGYIDFGSGLAPMLLSTKSGTVDRCPQSPVYSPAWGLFNIERTTSSGLTDPNERFPLFTQIVGRDFDFSVVAYDPTDLSSELPVDGYTVDVELIDAYPYDDNSSVFTCMNTDNSAIKSDNIFIQFTSPAKSRIDMTSGTDMQIGTALRNAAFRMWVLTDENGTVIPHLCAENDDACFINTVYDPYIKSRDTLNKCGNCTTYSNSRGKSGCYACLRDYFASPICSRDNFSIRPETYRMSILDANESNLTTAPKIEIANNNASNSASLAAEYLYNFEANATAYQSDIVAQGYYRDMNATLLFNDKSSCADQSDSNISFSFLDGQVRFEPIKSQPYTISHNNVGNYLLNLTDSTWTLVDQKIYPYKTFDSDDCKLNDGSTSTNGNTLSGCNTLSNFDATHQDINIQFEPYSYDVSNILMSTPNNTNTLYTNNLNTNNIADRAMAVRFNGPIIALGKQGTQLTNYTSSCAAKDMLFDINRTVTQNGNAINENSIMGIDLESNAPSKKIHFQRYDSSQDTNTTLQYGTENNDTNASTAIIVNRVQFRDENNGSANISLEYNFERKADQVMNPLAVTFNFKEANSTLASSSAHMNTNFIPEGNGTVNGTVNFIYGRIAPNSDSPYVVNPSEVQTTIPMYVEGYCSGQDALGVDMNCSLYNFNTPSPRDNGVWWVNKNHNSAQGDGNIQSLTDENNPSPLKITKNTDIALNNPTDITVKINNSEPRPYNTTILVAPSVPWLSYNPNGIFNPIVNFLGGGGWAGKGNTGLVVDTNASFNQNNKRIGW